MEQPAVSPRQTLLTAKDAKEELSPVFPITFATFAVELFGLIASCQLLCCCSLSRFAALRSVG
jgi:hypothetical protein